MDKKQDTENKRLVGIRDFMLYTGLGQNTATKIGKKAGCRVKVGRRILYDLRKADRYLDSLTEVE